MEFGGTTPWGPLQIDPQNQFIEQLIQSASFFDNSRHLGDNYFDLVWGYQTLENSPNGPPKN